MVDRSPGFFQGEAARGWECAGGRPRDPGVRLQEPCLDRSGLRPDPQLDDDARTACARRRSAARRRFWTGQTRRATSCGRIRPTGRRRTKPMLARRGLKCRASIARSPPGRPMPERMRIASTRRNPKSAARSRHVFAHQKGPMGLIVRTDQRHSPRQGENRRMANLAYNIRLSNSSG